MTTRMSEVVPEPEEPSPFGRDAPVHELTEEDANILRGGPKWPECEFEDCTLPTSFQQRDRFGVLHKACTGHEEALDSWVRIHNGWDEPEPVGTGDGSDGTGGGEGTKGDEAG